MEIAESINPINIILMYMIAFYTIAIVVIKIYLFLKFKNKPVEGEDGKLHSKINTIPFLGMNINLRTYSILIIAGIVYSFCGFLKVTDLHELKEVDYNKKVSFDQFYDTYHQNFYHSDFSINNEKQAIFYAAYGGGLKAHYWNYLILDTLKSKNKFNDILALSGVSGGGMGIGNYTAAEYLNYKKSEKDKHISKVRSSNILSIELSWLFGSDFIRSHLPKFINPGKDRSNRAMRYYSGQSRFMEL